MQILDASTQSMPTPTLSKYYYDKVKVESVMEKPDKLKPEPHTIILARYTPKIPAEWEAFGFVSTNDPMPADGSLPANLRQMELPVPTLIRHINPKTQTMTLYMFGVNGKTGKTGCTELIRDAQKYDIIQTLPFKKDVVTKYNWERDIEKNAEISEKTKSSFIAIINTAIEKQANSDLYLVCTDKNGNRLNLKDAQQFSGFPLLYDEHSKSFFELISGQTPLEITKKSNEELLNEINIRLQQAIENQQIVYPQNAHRSDYTSLPDLAVKAQKLQLALKFSPKLTKRDEQADAQNFTDLAVSKTNDLAALEPCKKGIFFEPVLYDREEYMKGYSLFDDHIREAEASIRAYQNPLIFKEGENKEKISKLQQEIATAKRGVPFFSIHPLLDQLGRLGLYFQSKDFQTKVTALIESHLEKQQPEETPKYLRMSWWFNPTSQLVEHMPGFVAYTPEELIATATEISKIREKAKEEYLRNFFGSMEQYKVFTDKLDVIDKQLAVAMAYLTEKGETRLPPLAHMLVSTEVGEVFSDELWQEIRQQHKDDPLIFSIISLRDWASNIVYRADRNEQLYPAAKKETEELKTECETLRRDLSAFIKAEKGAEVSDEEINKRIQSDQSLLKDEAKQQESQSKCYYKINEANEANKEFKEEIEKNKKQIAIAAGNLELLQKSPHTLPKETRQKIASMYYARELDKLRVSHQELTSQLESSLEAGLLEKDNIAKIEKTLESLRKNKKLPPRILQQYKEQITEEIKREKESIEQVKALNPSPTKKPTKQEEQLQEKKQLLDEIEAGRTPQTLLEKYEIDRENMMEKALQEKGTFDASYKEIEQKIKETKSKLEALNIALQKTNTDEPIPDSVIAEAKTYYQQLSESFQKENDEFTSKIKKNGNLISLLLANIEHIKKIPLLSAKEKELKDKQLQFERMKRHFANPAFSKDKVLKQMQDFVSQHQEQLSKLKTGEYQKEYASRPTSVTEEKDAQRKREDAQKQALELFSEQPDVTRSRNEFLKSSAYTTLLNKEQVSDNEVQKYTIDFVLEIMKTHFNKEQTKLPATVSLRHGLKINLLPSQTRLDIYKKYCDLSTAGSTILAINFKNQEQLTFSALNDVLCKLISEIDMSKPAGSDSELAGVLLQAQVAALTRHTKFLDGIIKELTDNSKKMQSLFADILAKAQEANKIVIGSGVALQSVIPGLQANIITINGLKTKLSEIENETKMYAIATPAEDIPLFAEIKGAENAINTKTTAINTTLQTMKKEIKEQTEKYQKALDGTKEYLEKRLEELSIEINNWTQEDKLALKLISVELMQKSDSLIKEQQDIVASLNEKNTQLTELLNKEPRDQKKLEEIKQSIEQDTKNLAQSNEQILAMQKEIQAQEKASYESNKLKLDDKKTKLETERQKVQTLLQEIAPLLSEEERERHNGQMDLYLETIQENAAQIETLHKDATSKLEGQIIQQNEIIKKANDAVADTKRKLTAIAENEQKVKAVITEVQKDLKKASDDLATIKVDASIGSDLAKEMIGKTNVPAEIDIYRPAIDDVLKYLRDQKTKDSTSAEKKAVAIEALLHDPHTTFQQIRVAAARFRTGGAVTVFFRDLFGIKTTSSKLLEKGIEEINKKRPKVTHDANWEQKRGATVKAIVDLQAEFKAKQTAHTSSLAFLQGMLQSAGKKEGVATGRVQQTEKYLQQDLAQAELSVLEKFKVLLQFGRDLEIKSDQAEEAGEKKENQLYELQAFKAFSEKMLSTIDNANTSFKKLQDQSNSLKDNLSALLAKVSMCEEFDYLNLKDAIDTNLSSIETGMDANDSDYKSLKIILASALIECAPLLISLQKLFEIDEPSLLTRFTNFFNITQPDKAKETALQEVRTAKSEIETTAGNMLRSVDPNFNLALVKVDNSENIKHLRIAIDSLKSRVRSESAAASASTDERLRKLRIAAGYGRGGEHAAPIEKEEQQQVQVVVSRPPSPPPSPKPSRDEPEAGPGPSGPSSSATPPPGEH